MDFFLEVVSQQNILMGVCAGGSENEGSVSCCPGFRVGLPASDAAHDRCAKEGCQYLFSASSLVSSTLEGS